MNAYLWYTLALRSPAIVSGESNDPNSAATRPFIPGSAIRGALAGRLLAENVDPEGEEFRRLILSGDVRFLHAYAEIGKARSLPVPVCLRAEKGQPGNGRDLADYDGDPTDAEEVGDFGEHWPKEDLAPAGAPFLSPGSSGGMTKVVPDIRARLHQQRDRRKGRPWKDRKNGVEESHGAIFAYEYLEAGQTFRGAIQLRPEAADARERIETLLKKAPVLVGRSRRAGYGGEADIRFEPDPIKRETGSVSGELSRDLAPGEKFRLRTLSACVVRDPDTGQIDPAALESAVRKRLGGRAELVRRRWNFERVAGFNRKWRLETPQAPAVAAGSVLVLRATAAIPQADLREIEHEGLGERRVEGFGRVVFLEQPKGPASIFLKEKEKDDYKPSASPETVPVSDEDRRTLRFLETRLMLDAARAELDAAASELAQKGGSISNSLIGRLRGLFRNARDKDTAHAALDNLGIWCGDGANGLKDAARRQLENCNANRQNLLGWLGDLAKCEANESGWETLKEVSGSTDGLNRIAEENRLTAKEAAQAILREQSPLLAVYLADAVLAGMARKNRGGER